MNENLIRPAFYTRNYKPSEVVAIRDRHQSYLYVKHGFYPVDMYVDSGENLVMIFPKNERGRELYEQYRKYELK